MKQIKLISQRLILEPRTKSEMQQLIDLENIPELKQAYQEMLVNMINSADQEEWGSNWKISLTNGEIVGGISFRGKPDFQGLVEIGYGITKTYQHQGYATEAVGVISAWALANNQVKGIRAETEAENKFSQKVLLNNGFIPKGLGQKVLLFILAK